MNVDALLERIRTTPGPLFTFEVSRCEWNRALTAGTIRGHYLADDANA